MSKKKTFFTALSLIFLLFIVFGYLLSRPKTEEVSVVDFEKIIQNDKDYFNEHYISKDTIKKIYVQKVTKDGFIGDMSISGVNYDESTEIKTTKDVKVGDVIYLRKHGQTYKVVDKKTKDLFIKGGYSLKVHNDKVIRKMVERYEDNHDGKHPMKEVDKDDVATH